MGSLLRYYYYFIARKDLTTIYLSARQIKKICLWEHTKYSFIVSHNNHVKCFANIARLLVPTTKQTFYFTLAYKKASSVRQQQHEHTYMQTKTQEGYATLETRTLLAGPFLRNADYWGKVCNPLPLRSTVGATSL